MLFSDTSSVCAHLSILHLFRIKHRVQSVGVPWVDAYPMELMAALSVFSRNGFYLCGKWYTPDELAYTTLRELTIR